MLEVNWNSRLHQTTHKNQLRRSSSMEMSATTSSCYNWNFCLQTLLKTFPVHRRLIFVILSAPHDNFYIVALYKSLFVFVFNWGCRLTQVDEWPKMFPCAKSLCHMLQDTFTSFTRLQKQHENQNVYLLCVSVLGHKQLVKDHHSCVTGPLQVSSSLIGPLKCLVYLSVQWDVI